MGWFSGRPKRAPEAAGAVMRFLTLGGAVVRVTEEQRATFWVEADPTGTRAFFPVRCLGCGHALDTFTSVEAARSEANGHAGSCRAMPRPGGE